MRAFPIAGALLLLSLGPVAAGPGDEESPADAAAPEESRFEILAEELDQAALRARTDSTVDEIVLIEAEEIALVAEQLLQEDDAALAVQLLEQAIALLVPRKE